MNKGIINKLLEIHNENFNKKVSFKYFEEIIECKLYDVYIIYNYEVQKMLEDKTIDTNKINGYIIYYNTFDSVDLFEISITKNMHNKGLGNKLLLETIEIIKEEKLVKQIILEVNENNKNAIYLYKKNKFKEISTRKNYYGIDENAIIMLREI